MPDLHREQSLFEQTSVIVSSGRPLSVLFEQLCALVGAKFDSSVVFIALAQSDGTTRLEYALDHGTRRFPGLPVDEGSTTAAIMRGGPAILRTAPADWGGYVRVPIRSEDPSTDDSVSAMFVPIRLGSRTIGVLSVQTPRPDAYDRRDIALVEQVAGSLAQAIRTHRPSVHGERRVVRAYTVTIVSVLIALTLAILAALTVATNELHARAIADQQVRVNTIARSLDEVLDEAGEVARNAGALIPLVPRTRRAAETIAKQLLDASPGLSIDGVGIWWKPYMFEPGVRFFAPYAARVKSGRAATMITNRYATKTYDYPNRLFYRRGLRASGVTFTPPYADNGHVFMSAVAPIYNRAGKVCGVASADVYGGDFAFTLGLSNVGASAFAFIAADDGRIIATSHDSAFRRYARAKIRQTVLQLDPALLRRYLDDRLGSSTTAFVVPVQHGLSVHIVTSNSALFVEALGIREAALAVIIVVWALGGAIVVLDRRRHRGGRRAQNLEQEKLELESEIAERQRAEERLRRFAYFDVLTDLPNRAFLFEHLTRSLEHAATTAEAFAVLYIDLDRFKIVNDSLGHAVGDELLIAVARRLEGALHANDIVARIGGDEFVVVLHHFDEPDHARHIAQLIIERISEPFDVRGSELYTGASVGVIANAQGYGSPSDVLRDADIAMYEAKGQGKDQFVLFDRALHTRTVAQLRLETDLRGAVDRNEFVLRYQPIVELATGRLSGYEALVRWQHPERGLLAPSEFIAISEQNRTIVRLGAWVAREAVRDFCSWGRSDLTLAVNVSVRQLVQNNFASGIAGILVAAGMDARAFKIEITESALMEDVETSARALRELRELGVQAHIDDFGTGYSSLSYLRRFPIECIKIDRSFVAEMTQRSEAFEIVRTIVTLASTLGLSVTAEGIETAEQFAACRSLGITFGQGYYISYPLEPAEAAENANRTVPASFAL